MEKWNAYNEKEELTDVLLVRGEPIPKGLYHLVCEVLVRHADGSYLVMKRSRDKELYPGRYEATSGGSALVGEDKWQCIRRELFEETGITCDSFTQIARNVYTGNIFYNFVCTVDCDKNSVTLQKGETEGFVWLDEADFIKFVNSDQMIDRQKERLKPYLISIGYIKE